MNASRRWVVAAAAVAWMGMLAAPVQAQAHDHGAAPPHALTLDHGRKWPTDAALRQGMARIRDLAAGQLPAARAGKLSAPQYGDLARKIEAEVAGIVANCKLPPDADAVLHVVIGEIGAGIQAMDGKDPATSPRAGLLGVAHAVNQYADHFDHPGLRPIREAH